MLGSSPRRSSDRGEGFPIAEYVSVAIVALAYFTIVARLRIVDDDEGFYALAGRAWMGGRAPYRDFFFPQMPLSAAFYGVARALLGAGLARLRLLDAVCAAGTTLCVHHAARRADGRLAGILAATLFAAHTLVWEWATTVKTFPLGLLCGTAALVVATHPRLTRTRAFVAGALAGATVAARALSLPIAVVALAALAKDGEASGPRGKRIAAGLGGFTLGLAPALALAALDPRAFWFDNVTYHALRSPGIGLVKDAAQKLDAARAVFLSPWGAWRPDATGVQTTALLVAVAMAIGSRAHGLDARARARLVPFAVATFATVATAFLPSPVWVQYFAAAVAPASIVAGCWLASRRGLRRVATGAIVAYVVVMIPSWRDRLVVQPPALRSSAVDAVGVALDALTNAGDRVAAHWPSYLVASKRWPIDASLNQFARLYSDRVPEADRRRYHLYTEAEFRAELLGGEARAFVVGSFVVPATASALSRAGFRRLVDLPGASVWLAPRTGPENPSGE